MIIKSLSRKSRTAANFRQLKAYMDRDGVGVGFAWNLRMPWFAPDDEVVRAFTDNMAVLKERHNGVKLYHEIVSLKRDDRLPVEVQQAIIHDVTMEWLAARAPEQLAYGRLHVAREHLHVHLMLSANREGNERPVRLSKAEFANLQRQVEARILARYPQLRQERVYDAPEREPRTFRHPRPEQRERPAVPEPGPAAEIASGRSVDRDHVAAVVRDALAHAADGRSCQEALRACDVVTHRRGSTVSFEYRERRYRLLSLGLPYESASRFHAYLGLPPPAPGRVAQAEREAAAAAEAPASPGRASSPAQAPETSEESKPEPLEPARPAAAASGETAPVPSWREILAHQPAAVAKQMRRLLKRGLAGLGKQSTAMSRDTRRLLELAVFGDGRAAYWDELLRSYRAGRPAKGKPGMPPRRDLPGTRRVPPALRRLWGAMQDEPAAFSRDVRRLLHDLVIGVDTTAEPSLEDVAAQTGFRSAGPWKPLPPDVQRKAEEQWRQQQQAATPPPGPAAREPAQASDGTQTPHAGPAAPDQPMPDPRWEAEWRRRQAARKALLRSYVRHQEQQRQRAQERKRARKRGRRRDDPGMGGR